MLRLAACLPALLLVAACSNPSRSPSGEAPVPDDLEVVLGMEGGFAGRMTGYTLTADGAVTRWEGKYVGENVRRTGQASADEVAALWRRTQAADFFAREQRRTGNMTRFLTIRADARSHRVSWPTGPGTDAADTSLHALYDAWEALAEGATAE